MLVAAAVCPCPPLLVPEVASGAAAELDALRDACGRALGELAAASPDHLCVVGPVAPGGSGRYPRGAEGSFRMFGVDRRVRLGKAADVGSATDAPVGGHPMPPSLAVGAWLLEQVRWSTPCEALGVETTLDVQACLEAGRALAAAHERVVLLVLGDGSARLSEKAPGHFDPRAAAFDAAVAEALGGADAAALAELDPGLAEGVQAAGRAPWQVLAGAANGMELTGRLLHDDAPYGVGYFVALWS